jgi:hypothetical protein
MNTFLQIAKSFTQAITAAGMADVISRHFPQQYPNVIRLALKLTSWTKELDLVLRGD